MFECIELPHAVKMTRALAKKYSEMERFPDDREMRESRVSLLLKAIDEHSFRTCEWASAVCIEDGKEYRVNGKHTSHIFSEHREPNGYVAIVSKYRGTMEDIARLYATFDSRISARSNKDINLVYARSVPSLANVQSRIIDLAIAGLSIHKWEYAAYQQPVEDRCVLLLDHPDFALWLTDVLQKRSIATRPLARAPVVAAMARTWLKSKSAADTFWIAVRDETDPKPNLPTRVLMKYLSRGSIYKGAGVNTGKVRSDPREMMVKCLHAWNAWRRGVTTDMKYFPNAKIPAAS